MIAAGLFGEMLAVEDEAVGDEFAIRQNVVDARAVIGDARVRHRVPACVCSARCRVEPAEHVDEQTVCEVDRRGKRYGR